MSRILLDTCTALWLMSGALPLEAADRLRAASAIGISPITAWEVSLLVSKKRAALAMSVRTWISRLTDVEGVHLLVLSTDILIAANELPGQLHRDPADRILAATARETRYALMTRDRALLDYADAGHLQAIPC